MKGKLIYGIQQIGIGVSDVSKAFEWYATRFGSDVRVFDDQNTATYMAPYMGGQPHDKRAILAMNLQGGSGYELWQYTDRKPQAPDASLRIGDLGINAAHVKSRNVERTHQRLQELGDHVLGPVVQETDGRPAFYLKDPFDNLLKVKEFDNWYAPGKGDTGGPFGCTLGVSDIDASLVLYRDLLKYDRVIYDRSGVFEDLAHVPGGNARFRRVLLGHTEHRQGGFSPLFGSSHLELIQALDEKRPRIFENRYWGDLGYIHLCFDIRNMRALTEESKALGFPFTILSDESFDMGDANGHFGYIEDPDGTLIEFVETHKVPVIEWLNWSIKLKNRDPFKSLPNWLIKAMAFKRVRFQ